MKIRKYGCGLFSGSCCPQPIKFSFIFFPYGEFFSVGIFDFERFDFPPSV